MKQFEELYFYFKERDLTFCLVYLGNDGTIHAPEAFLVKNKDDNVSNKTLARIINFPLGGTLNPYTTIANRKTYEGNNRKSADFLYEHNERFKFKKDDMVLYFQSHEYMMQLLRENDIIEINDIPYDMQKEIQ